ncbi:predicted protein [Botrytis cinerea T4]|uniref:Uncharacterized protein n=1 Tax=Botryotinia fuckeliana (strain T4) TaxID=999810 RepID=G2XUR1_BOTF4|nr:predicted protein [Botrytis cinerea T4]
MVTRNPIQMRFHPDEPDDNVVRLKSEEWLYNVKGLSALTMTIDLANVSVRRQQ